MSVAKTAPRSQKREVKVRVRGRPRWPGSFWDPVGRAPDHRSRACLVILGVGRVHLLLRQVRPRHRREAAGRARSPTTAKIFAAPGFGRGGRCAHAGRDRHRAAAQRLHANRAAIRSATTRSSPNSHRDLSRARFLLRPGARRDQLRQRQDLADRLASGQHAAPAVSARAAAHHQSLRAEPREAAHGEVPRTFPPVLVQAVTSAEDKRFFQHTGFDPIRIVKAAYVDLKEGRKEPGRLHAQHAARAHVLARPGQALDAQAGRADHHPAAGAEASRSRRSSKTTPTRSTWAGAARFNIRGFGAGGGGLSRQGPQPDHICPKRRSSPG